MTGLLGFGLGPIISMYLALSNGAQVVGTALGGTAVIFLGLAGYAMTSKRDFSFMGGFVAIGLMVMIIGIIANISWQTPAVRCDFPGRHHHADERNDTDANRLHREWR